MALRRTLPSSAATCQACAQQGEEARAVLKMRAKQSLLKMRSWKGGRRTHLQIFYYLLETSKIHFISSAVPVLDVGELPAVTSNLGSTSQGAAIAGPILAFHERRKPNIAIINEQNTKQKVLCWGCVTQGPAPGSFRGSLSRPFSTAEDEVWGG